MAYAIQTLIGRGRNNREEQSVVNQIMFYCRSVPGYMVVRHKNTAAVYTDRRSGLPRFGRDKFRDPGAPDLFVLRKGKHYAVEAKASKGQARKEQLEWAERWRACGGIYILAHNFEEFRTAIETE